MRSHATSWKNLILLFVAIALDKRNTQALRNGFLMKTSSTFIKLSDRCKGSSVLVGQTKFLDSQKGNKNTQSCLWSSPKVENDETVATKSPVYPFIETELRRTAMKLHTRSQAPKEGKAEEKKSFNPDYVTTHEDYLAFLVDSKHVYEAFEEAVNSDKYPELTVFRNTGLERTVGLEKDIQFIVKEYNVVRPEVGTMGKNYSSEIKRIVGENNSLPEFMCHFYNFYFAHTAGGIFIGKKMSSLLLDKKTLEFYKWDGNINEIKHTVKTDIEALAATWSSEEKAQCVDATGATFRFGGALNYYLAGKRS